jgi:hypothetical protein
MENDHGTTMNSIVAKSNRCASIIQNGKYDESAGLLASALTDLSSFARREANGRSESLEHHHHHHQQQQDLDNGGITFATNHLVSEGMEDENDEFYFVKRPLLISPELDLTRASLNIISYCVVYNLALSWHLWSQNCTAVSSDSDGHGGDDDRRGMLTKALTLYKLAYSLLTTNEETMVASQNDYLSLICNIGHASSSLGDDDGGVNKYFQVLLESILYVVAGGERNPEPLDYGMFKNVTHLILKKEESAPAA